MITSNAATTGLRKRHQSGVALISVLLVVVIATILSVSMIRHQNLTIHSVRNAFDRSQAVQYALGGEELARQILYSDRDSNDPRDHLQEEWAQERMLFEFEDGEVALRIVDLQSRLNVNQVATPGAVGRESQARLRNLLVQLGLDVTILARITDWLDSDISTRDLGAEDYDYLGLERPYRTAGQLIGDLSELRLLLDMDHDTYSLLIPYLSALPDQNSQLNINTMSAEVLQTLSPELTLDVATNMVMEREEQSGFASISDFLQSPYVAGMGISESGLSVQSSFFQIQVQARYLDQYGYLTSVVQRNPTDGSMRVIYRNQSSKTFLLDPVEVVPADDGDTTNG
jgi:general secretion pathway protein K